MKKALVALATVGLLAACSGSASASTPSEVRWHKIDERLHVGCWHGVLIFWSEVNGDIATVPSRGAGSDAVEAAGCS